MIIFSSALRTIKSNNYAFANHKKETTRRPRVFICQEIQTPLRPQTQVKNRDCGSPKSPRLTGDEIRLGQVYVVFEGTLSMYYMDTREHPTIVPEVLVFACDLLERVRILRTPGRPAHNHVAAACVWIGYQFLSDLIGCFTIGTFVKSFLRVDNSITSGKLARAQKWILKAVNFDLWQPLRIPLLEQDENLDSRNLQELGFISEQFFYPPSMITNTIHDADVVQTFINTKKHKNGGSPGYIDMQNRFRLFCRDPMGFQVAFFGWSLEIKNV